MPVSSVPTGPSINQIRTAIREELIPVNERLDRIEEVLAGHTKILTGSTNSSRTTRIGSRSSKPQTEPRYRLAMTDEAPKRCGTCRYWDRDGYPRPWEVLALEENETGSRGCRYNPPVLIVWPLPDGQGHNLNTDWPHTAADDWCGRWEARPADSA